MSTAGDQELSRGALVALVVGSMVGAGIFALPAAFGRTTGALGALIAWGLKFLLLSALLYAPGTILYYFARREQKAALFTPAEMIVFGALRIAALAALAALVSGALTI